jgi:hypothetical protein
MKDSPTENPRADLVRWRKKPVIIEAIQVRDDGSFSWNTWWIQEAMTHGRVMRYPGINGWSIRTLEGVMNAEPGDWIIQGVKGELYPCKPDIFEATYEPA